MLTDDPLSALERQLVHAASRAPVRWRTSRRVAVAIAAVLVVAVPAGAATGLWTGLFTTGSLAPPPRIVDRAPSAELRGLLGVLRRPQTASDRNAQVVRWTDWVHLTPSASHRPLVELPGVRMANRIGPYRVYLVPLASDGRDVIAVAFTAGSDEPGGQGCCLDAATIRSGLPGPSLITAMPGAGTLIAFVVPDGVASVALDVPRATIRLPARGNVAAVTVHRGISTLRVRRVTWYDRAGKAIKQLGR
jgi:hypothetical protein